MTVPLVLLTFLVFIVIDIVLSRRKAPATAPAEAQPASAEKVSADYIEGYRVPELLRYHPGHAWLLRERRNVMRIGADEFAAALAGKIDRIELPKPGHWIRQGQAAWSFERGGEKVEMVSPIEGEVVEVNQDLANDPSLLRQDPYGRGWLVTVFAPDEESTLRNLLPRNLVRGWMQEAVARLYSKQPQLAGAVAADGGRPAEDLAAGLAGSWAEVAGEFFLSRKPASVV